MKLLIINGPNLNLLGLREPDIYGKQDYAALKKFIRKSTKELGVKVKLFQSNCEGEIVTEIQKARGRQDGIVINAGAYTHTSLAILDALKAAEVPAVDVHITDIHSRESYRNFSYVAEYAFCQIAGHGFDGYREAMEKILAL